MKFYTLEKTIAGIYPMKSEIRNGLEEILIRDAVIMCYFYKCYSSPNLCSSNTDQKFTFDAIKLYPVNTETNCTYMGGTQWGLKF